MAAADQWSRFVYGSSNEELIVGILGVCLLLKIHLSPGLLQQSPTKPFFLNIIMRWVTRQKLRGRLSVLVLSFTELLVTWVPPMQTNSYKTNSFSRIILGATKRSQQVACKFNFFFFGTAKYCRRESWEGIRMLTHASLFRHDSHRRVDTWSCQTWKNY